MNKMKEHRISKNMSMKSLSMETGVSERYLYFIENGEKNPSIHTAKKIANVLEESIDAIFFSTE